jgi:hypothetical protein
VGGYHPQRVKDSRSDEVAALPVHHHHHHHHRSTDIGGGGGGDDDDDAGRQ